MLLSNKSFKLISLLCVDIHLNSGCKSNCNPFYFCATLGKYIRHYEPLFYDHHSLHQQHHRLKRSPSVATDTLGLDVRAFGRSFKIRLKRDTSVYSEDVVIETSRMPVAYDLTRAYSGRLEGDQMSFVHGVVTTGGHFEGKIVQHVQSANPIYSAIDFDGDGSPDNIRFTIKRIKIHDNKNAEGYKYPGNYGVESFLDLHSGDDYDGFCLPTYSLTGTSITAYWVWPGPATHSCPAVWCERYKVVFILTIRAKATTPLNTRHYRNTLN
ncbi:hypothetical protein ScPMuIL_003064 [Solemya velum]